MTYTIVANSAIFSLFDVIKTLFRTTLYLWPGIFWESIFMSFICQKHFLFGEFEVNFHVLTTQLNSENT